MAAPTISVSAIIDVKHGDAIRAQKKHGLLMRLRKLQQCRWLMITSPSISWDLTWVVYPPVLSSPRHQRLPVAQKMRRAWSRSRWRLWRRQLRRRFLYLHWSCWAKRLLCRLVFGGVEKISTLIPLVFSLTPSIGPIGYYCTFFEEDVRVYYCQECPLYCQEQSDCCAGGIHTWYFFFIF